jgi:hypothetical protein
MKTNELSGAALDWAAAKAWQPVYSDKHLLEHAKAFHPSTDWAHGGPIIERESLSLECWRQGADENTAWAATRYDQPAISEAYGPTPLIAAMRCYVASRLGDEVDVPPELT